jgi:uncharacterized cupin superfamily protein
LSDDGKSAFVSHSDANEWERDEETGGLVHWLRVDDAVQAGLWKPGELAGETIELELIADETILVTDGSGELSVDGGTPIELRPGVIVSIRKGSRTIWRVDADFKEFWIYSNADS